MEVVKAIEAEDNAVDRLYEAIKLYLVQTSRNELGEEDGKRYVYLAAESRQAAAKSAVQNVMETFFGGSLEGMVRTFLSSDESKLSKDELNQLANLIEEAKKREEA